MQKNKVNTMHYMFLQKKILIESVFSTESVDFCLREMSNKAPAEILIFK